jgi:hypothetical protein
VTHSIARKDSKFIGAVSTGWSQILSNLRSLMETGAVILPPMDFTPGTTGGPALHDKTVEN